MALQRERTTLAQFQDYVVLPEHQGQLFELINGEIIPVSPGRTRDSQITHLLAVAIYPFCQAHHLPCYTSSGEGAYLIDGNIVAPDFAYKTTPMSEEYPDPTPPLVVVEVISPTDKASDIRDKREIYLKAMILYWEMYPQTQSVDVYAPGKPLQSLHLSDMLDGGDVLPGFSLSLKELFRD